MLKSLTTTKTLNNVHPGEVLREEFLLPMNISAYSLAKEIKIPQSRISAIIKCKRAVTADTAIRLSRFFGTTPDFWLNLQSMYDIEEEERKKSEVFDSIKKYAVG